MIPILTPGEMRAVDAASPVSVEVLIERAGSAVARAALRMLGGAYGRNVVVLAGPGNNGADGRVAARRLAARGIRVRIVDLGRDHPTPPTLPASDLVIDAAFGSGFHGAFDAPVIAPDTPVLAVDIPSGVDARTGAVADGCHPWRATRTVTFAALKPGLILGPGAGLCGVVEVVDIGLDVSTATMFLLEPSDLAARVPQRARDAHKWKSAVAVFGGAPGMTGAPSLVAGAAARAGVGMVRVCVPGVALSGTEAVGIALPVEHWVNAAVEAADRCHCAVVGPGLGRSRETRASVRSLLLRLQMPLVVDADAIVALGAQTKAELPAPSRAARRGARPVAGSAPATEPTLLPGQRAVLQATARRVGASAETVAAIPVVPAELVDVLNVLAARPPGSTVLTPHDGEFAHLTGHRPGPDRIEDARSLAQLTGAVVLLKGPTTVIASPDGTIEVVVGDARLATAGSGDVLAGIIGALIAQGIEPSKAAATGALLHAEAALRGHPVGLVAGDLPGLVADVLSDVGSR